MLFLGCVVAWLTCLVLVLVRGWLLFVCIDVVGWFLGWFAVLLFWLLICLGVVFGCLVVCLIVDYLFCDCYGFGLLVIILLS